MGEYSIVLLIIVINIAYVSLFTVRLIFIMKGYRLLASAISMVEVFIYLIGLTIVLDNIDKPLNILAYSLGFAGGVYLGGKIEEWLALGYVTLQIVVDTDSSRVPISLRERGFGVTSWLADGKDGQRVVMQVLAKRNQEKKLMRTIQDIAPKAFIISYEPRFLKGGFWTKRLL
jgi:uncharacterized protein YebE (UPF0316 family)